MFNRLILLLATVAFLGGCKMDVAKSIDAGMDAAKAVSLSDAEVKQLGRDSAAALDGKNKVAPGNAAYSKRLDKIVSGLKSEDGLQLNFKVYQTNDVNAFALPDGSIRVYSGLMDIMNDDEVYFVIGHEIGHVKNGDSAGRMKMAYATSAARKAADAAGGTIGALSRTQLADLGEAVIHAQFSQSQESAADAYGLRMMEKYKKNTEYAVSGLKKLASPGRTSSMLDSHPDPMKRAEKIESMRKK